ncbi:DAK2 domain-containing protein [Streptomyces sp. 796.1]|uniref:DAK2 domain-containing protein n=1 Tax=Streptomyces sp. 796.1 TaxID=3163029 RepID=UPI0039C8CF2A
MPHPFDAEAVRTWCGLALEALGRAREGIDAINVYPVADGDTGTNLYLTVESAAQAVSAAFDGHAVTGAASRPSLGDAMGAMAHGALIGAHGNSGTILAQMLRGMADVLSPHGAPAAASAAPRDARHADGADLARALTRAAESARQAVARPVEGTVLTVAAQAAAAASQAVTDQPRPTADGAGAPRRTERGAGLETPDLDTARSGLATERGTRGTERGPDGARGAGHGATAAGPAGAPGGAPHGDANRPTPTTERAPAPPAGPTEAPEATATEPQSSVTSGASTVGAEAGFLTRDARTGAGNEAGTGPGLGATPSVPRNGAPSVGEVARAAHAGACTALDATTGQLDALARAGVVDAGGYGLVTVLGALAEALTGERPTAPTNPLRTLPDNAGPVPRRADSWAPEARQHPPAACPQAAPSPGALPCCATATDGGTSPTCATSQDTAALRPGDVHGEQPGTSPAYEVIYLLEADETAVARLRAKLDALGDSLVIVGGDGLWNVHVHVDDAGAAVEAGIQAGRPYRLRITHFGAAAELRRGHGAPPSEQETGHRARGAGRSTRGDRAARSVVAVVPGDGLAALCTEAGATVVTTRPGEPPASGELVEAIRRAHAHEVVVLPNDAELRHTAAAAAAQMRTEGVRVALIPTRSVVQGIAALAVHERDRGFDEDVVAMTSAAGATRYAELAVAERQSWTMAGVCQAGDVLGMIDGDVAVIGADLLGTARTVLDRMLAAGGELVTLVLGAGVPSDLAERLERHVRETHLAVDTISYRGEQPAAPLLIGIE